MSLLDPGPERCSADSRGGCGALEHNSNFLWPVGMSLNHNRVQARAPRVSATGRVEPGTRRTGRGVCLTETDEKDGEKMVKVVLSERDGTGARYQPGGEWSRGAWMSCRT